MYQTNKIIPPPAKSHLLWNTQVIHVLLAYTLQDFEPVSGQTDAIYNKRPQFSFMYMNSDNAVYAINNHLTAFYSCQFVFDICTWVEVYQTNTWVEFHQTRIKLSISCHFDLQNQSSLKPIWTCKSLRWLPSCKGRLKDLT